MNTQRYIVWRFLHPGLDMPEDGDFQTCRPIEPKTQHFPFK
jgi:hypothetical protein